MGILLWSAVALGQTGCMVLAAGAVGGGVAALGIKRGTVTRTFAATVPDTAQAVQSALTDLGLPVERPRIGTNLAEIDSTLEDGSPVLLTIRAEPREPSNDTPQSRVEIHIRVFGDRPRSEWILDRVEYRLKNPAQTVTPPGSFTPPPSSTVPMQPMSQTEEPELAPTKSP